MKKSTIQLLKFAAVGGLGLAMIEGWLALSVGMGGLNPYLMLVLILEPSIVVSFILNDRLLFTQGKRFRLRTRFLAYEGQTVVSRVINIGAYAVMLPFLYPLSAEFLAVCCAFGVNWLMAARFTWRPST